LVCGNQHFDSTAPKIWLTDKLAKFIFDGPANLRPLTAFGNLFSFAAECLISRSGKICQHGKLTFRKQARKDMPKGYNLFQLFPFGPLNPISGRGTCTKN